MRVHYHVSYANDVASGMLYAPVPPTGLKLNHALATKAHLLLGAFARRAEDAAIVGR
jgi:hypothetical protein